MWDTLSFVRWSLQQSPTASNMTMDSDNPTTPLLDPYTTNIGGGGNIENPLARMQGVGANEGGWWGAGVGAVHLHMVSCLGWHNVAAKTRSSSGSEQACRDLKAVLRRAGNASVALQEASRGGGRTANQASLA
jgi:hypothetical protein